MNRALDEVARLVRALKPVLGDKAEKYKQVWLVSDRHGREEVEQLLLQEFAKCFPDKDEPAFPPPIPEELPREGVEVGDILYRGLPTKKLFIPLQSLLRHVMIAGTTGSGKTTLIYQFCAELLRLKVPFFLFDFKLDYRPLVRVDPSVRVYTIGSQVQPLHFNPLLELCKHMVRKDKARDLNPLFQLSDVLCRVFYTGHGVRSILNKAFGHLLREWIDHQYSQEYEPSFRRALAWVRDYEPKNEKGMRFREWKVSTIRVLEMLVVGTFGDSINASQNEHVNLQDLRKQTAVFELNLPEDLKTVFVEMLLLCTRIANMEELKERVRGELQNVMIIDESHNLLKEGFEKIESQLQIALREDRGLGTAYIVADQTPSQLDATAYANTHFKFFFALDQADDIRVASKSLLLELDERKHLAKLSVGHCLCRYGRHNAFLMRAQRLDDIKHAIVTDTEIQHVKSSAPQPSDLTISALVDDFDRAVQELRASLDDSSESSREAGESGEEQPIEAGSSTKQASSVSDKGVMTSVEQALLDDILKEPFAGINQHFKNVGVSTANGRRARASLEGKGLLEVKAIGLGDRGGQLLLAALTEQGAELLRQQGKDARHPYFQNGGEHEFWKDRFANHFSRLGYTVRKEAPVNGHADLLATKGGERIAIEIETGKSDIRANIEKYRGKNYTRVILFATNPGVGRELYALAEQSGSIGVPVEVWNTNRLANSG